MDPATAPVPRQACPAWPPPDGRQAVATPPPRPPPDDDTPGDALTAARRAQAAAAAYLARMLGTEHRGHVHAPLAATDPVIGRCAWHAPHVVTDGSCQVCTWVIEQIGGPPGGRGRGTDPA